MVYIPTLKYIACRYSIGSLIVILRSIRTIGNSCYLLLVSDRDFISDSVVIAVVVGTVHEIYFVIITCVVEADCTTATHVCLPVNKSGIGTKLVITCQFNKIFTFSKEIIFGWNSIAILNK